jgi:hypothetical protein
MANRVMLCAIAKDEGAYLADWVFHHRHFGFDAIRVYINRTQDHSVELMEAIQAIDPAVDFRVVDELYEFSVRRQRHFQREAYQRLARGAAKLGYSHVAFFDLDEYWTPSDLSTPIHQFIPADPAVNVVSFSWALDVPDTGRTEFAPALAPAVDIQLDPHVKSVVRLDERVERFRTHTARTSSGIRLLVRDPLPIRDERAQQWGSLLAPEDHQERVSTIPEAFLLHAIYRSEVEYVASLVKASGAKGRHQAAEYMGRYKSGRGGYRAGSAPILRVVFPADAFSRYERARKRFRTSVGADHLVAESEQLVRSRAATVIREAVDDPEVMRHLRGPLRGVTAPELDHTYPGWDGRVD